MCRFFRSLEVWEVNENVLNKGAIYDNVCVLDRSLCSSVENSFNSKVGWRVAIIDLGC